MQHVGERSTTSHIVAFTMPILGAFRDGDNISELQKIRMRREIRWVTKGFSMIDVRSLSIVSKVPGVVCAALAVFFVLTTAG
jgi:hypothetical protein